MIKTTIIRCIVLLVCNLIVPEIAIDTFVTIGSPLGMPIIVSKIAEEMREYYPDIQKIRTPKNIQNNWFNFSDIETKLLFKSSLPAQYSHKYTLGNREGSPLNFEGRIARIIIFKKAELPSEYRKMLKTEN